MNAIQFIKENGVDEAREVVGASANALVQCRDGKTFHVNDLKRLVESVERVNFIGGVDDAKIWVEKTRFGLERDHYSLSSIATIKERLKRNEQAIADYEAIYSDDDSDLEYHVSTLCKIEVK